MKTQHFIRITGIFFLMLGFARVTSGQVRPYTLENTASFHPTELSTDTLKAEIVRLLNQTLSKHFREPNAPRFLLIDQQQRYALGIGGYVRTTASMGFKDVIPGTAPYNFIPATIPSTGQGLANSQYLMTANTSQIFLKMVGKNQVLGTFSTYVSMNFTGGSNGLSPQLRQAFISFRGFQIGRAWNTICDQAAIPPTVDFAAPNGLSGFINMMIQYTHNIGKRWQFGLAVELPSVSANYAATQSAISQGVPDLTAYWQYSWQAGNSHLRLSGLFRDMSYRNLTLSRNNHEIGWAAQLSGLTGIGKKMTLFYQLIYGEGIGSYVNDPSNLNVDLVPDANRPGHMLTLPMYGWYVGLQYNFSAKVFASATYSQSRVYSKSGYQVPDAYRSGQYIVANTFVNLTDNLQLGIEYLYGRRMSYNKQANGANRINLMAQYTF